MDSTLKLNLIFGNEDFDPEHKIWNALTDVHPNIPYDTVFDDNTEKQNDYIYVCLRSLNVKGVDFDLDEALRKGMVKVREGQKRQQVLLALANIQNKDIRQVLTYLMNK